MWRALLVLCVWCPRLSSAQGDSTQVVRGSVRDSAGRPVRDADVFLLATLEGGSTDSAGRFAFRSAARGNQVLITRKIGYTPARLEVALPLRDSLSVVLLAEAKALEEITVSAGSYIAGEERGAQLTPLEVATTPGTTADIGRTIQTLPGVQTVDEGNALFVRGGDWLETKVFVNDALLLSGFRYDTPTGTFTSTPNAFLLDGIYFSSGGFGARFGNALSGVVSLRTLGRPIKNGGTLAVGLGNLAGSGALTPSRNTGIRATLSRFSTRPILWLNGSPRDYRPAPNGLDASVSGIWSYRPSGELKLFAISQSSRLGVMQELPDESGIYRTRTRNRVAILSWHDSFGRFSETATFSLGARRQREEFGSFQIDTDTDVAQFFTYAGFEVAERVTMRAGGEWERLAARFLKGSVFSSHATDNRVAGFVEGDWRATDRLKITPGFRMDRANLAARASADPRLAAAWLLGSKITLTMAAGVYHQVPEPLFFDSTLGSPRLKSMHAEQLVGGVQVGDGDRILRLEVYGKRYRDLAQMNREHRVVAGGVGDAEGLDFFLKTTAPWQLKGRLAYSYIHARRTDPETQVLAPAPADVTHALTLVVERPIGTLSAGIAAHYATGRPYTAVLAATYDAATNTYQPVYGAPMGSRVPDLVRLDANLSRLIAMGRRGLLVVYLSVNNLLDRENVYQYTYTRDYTQRIAIPSLFNRSFYFGATLTTR